MLSTLRTVFALLVVGSFFALFTYTYLLVRMKHLHKERHMIPSSTISIVSSRSPTAMNPTLENPDIMPFLLMKNTTPSFTLGAGHKEKVSVVIGIPTVRRPRGVSYLEETLESFLRHIYPADEEDTEVVVLIAEEDEEYVRQRAAAIYKLHSREVNTGMLQVIGPPKNFYPNFSALQQTLGDSRERTHWRSKEVIDAALLMYLCRHKADHYLMMEDDVIASRGYMTAMQDFVSQHAGKEYPYLSFAPGYGSIGKLFRTSDIPRWTTHLLNVYNEKPIDWLMTDFVHLLKCLPKCSVEKLIPELQKPLFKHIGDVSSLAGQRRRNIVRKYSPAVSRTYHRNPPCKVTISNVTGIHNEAQAWYEDSGGMSKNFHLLHSKRGDMMNFTFDSYQEVKRILIRTGRIGEERRNRLCKSCAQILLMRGKSSNSTASNGGKNAGRTDLCASSDANGDIECRPQTRTRLSSFILRFMKDLASVTFDIVYVQSWS